MPVLLHPAMPWRAADVLPGFMQLVSIICAMSVLKAYTETDTDSCILRYTMHCYYR